MADIVTVQELQDASLDVQTLETFINGDENTVNYPRLLPNVDVGSLAELRKKALEKMPVNATSFKTKADLTANTTLADNSFAFVHDDATTSNNGLYQKVSGVWVWQQYNNMTNGTVNAIWFKLASTTKVTFDRLTRTLSWNGSILLPTKYATSNRLVLPAHSITFANSNYQVAWIDLRLAKTTFNVADIVKISTYSSADAFVADKHQLPIFFYGSGVESPESGFFYSDLIDKYKLESTYTRYKKTTATNLSIFNRGQLRNFIELNFERETVAFDGTTNNSNLDCWRLKGGWECDQNFNRIKEIIQPGAWELAVRERGALDSVGTYHGDEVLTDAFFVIGDIAFEQNAVFDVTNPKSFEFVQKSDLFRCNTQTKIADVLRHYDFKRHNFTLRQSVKFVTDVVVQDAWMSMLPIYRQNTTSQQITDSAVRITNNTLYNDSIANTTFSITPTSFFNDDVVKIYGTSSKISASLKLLESPNLQNQQVFISNADAYNKIYFDVTGYQLTDVSVKADTTWTTKTEYSVTTSN